MKNLVSIAKILNFHGIQGEVKLGFSKGQEDIIKALKKVFIVSSGEKIELNVKNVRFSKTFAIVKFKEFSSINDVLPYKNQNIFVNKENLSEKLSDDEFLIDDLVGMNVFDNSDEFVGVIESVASNGATDILVVKPENGDIEQYLIPFVADLVPVVDIKHKRVIVKPIEGLFDEVWCSYTFSWSY